MDNFDLRKYLAEGRLFEEEEGPIGLFKNWLNTQTWLESFYDKGSLDIGKIKEDNPEIKQIKTNYSTPPKSDDPSLQAQMSETPPYYEKIRQFVKDKFEKGLNPYLKDRGYDIEYGEDHFKSYGLGDTGHDDGISLDFTIKNDNQEDKIEGTIYY